MDRYRRFAEVCKQHKCKITAIDAGSKILNFQSGPTIWKKYISHFDGIDGLFTADVTAAACMKMLQKKGIKIPKKLKVVGYDGLDFTRFLTPDRIERLLEAAGIAGKRDTPAGKLSFGQQQRVAFIRCLCQPFDFILLDEPVSHLDAANGEVLSALLLEGAQAQGAGVIVTSVGSRLRLPYHKIFTL